MLVELLESKYCILFTDCIFHMSTGITFAVFESIFHLVYGWLWLDNTCELECRRAAIFVSTVVFVVVRIKALLADLYFSFGIGTEKGPRFSFLSSVSWCILFLLFYVFLIFPSDQHAVTTLLSRKEWERMFTIQEKNVRFLRFHIVLGSIHGYLYECVWLLYSHITRHSKNCTLFICVYMYLLLYISRQKQYKCIE